MERPRLRPLFRLTLPIARERLTECVRASLSQADSRIVGQVMRRHVELTIRSADRHVWSPHLSLDLFDEDGGTLLRGRYAPHPHLWMLIAAVYGLLSLAAIACVVWAMSQCILGVAPWAFWGVPLCAAGIALTWLASAIGQGLAQPQMHELQTFLEDCTARASDPPVRSQAQRALADSVR